MEAKDLKVGNSFKKQGYEFTVVSIEKDTYKNGTDCLNVICTCSYNNHSTKDSTFSFKPTTKVKFY